MEGNNARDRSPHSADAPDMLLPSEGEVKEKRRMVKLVVGRARFER
jgi:hypothetical protein